MNTPFPTHPATGLSAIGWRKARTGEDGEQPIWPVLGGAEGTDDTENAEDESGAEGVADAGADGGAGNGDADPDGADQLGDAGKRALDAMKAKVRDERERRKAAETELAGFKAKPADATDAAALRSEALATARSETLRERAMDRLEAKAARLFADPEDARALLAAKADEFIDDGQIDSDAITKALAALLKAKPHLGAQGGKRFEAGADGGARKGSNAPAQLTEQDLKRMSPEQIVDARIKGQLADLLG